MPAPDADLLRRKLTHFSLWRPGDTSVPPTLFIGDFMTSGPDIFAGFREIPLAQSAQFPELWEVAAAGCGLTDGQICFYWFKCRDTRPGDLNPIYYRTDPLALTVDRRFKPPAPSDPGGQADPNSNPASVIQYKNGQLLACDPGGQTPDWTGDAAPSALPPNNRLVIYELPTAWTNAGVDGSIEVGIGVFRDVLAQLEPATAAPNFPTVDALNLRAHMIELHVNALELLPPADCDTPEQWGYGTANYLAADYFYGLPPGATAPTATADLVDLIRTCHENGIRFFLDVVMAFSRNDPYSNINFLDFHIQFCDPTKSPCSLDPEQGARDGFGGDLLKYNFPVTGYDPISGAQITLFPSRQYMKVFLDHWMEFYRVDGLRLDSVNNIARPEFVKEFKDYARSLWTGARGGTDDRFLVVGEELSEPPNLLANQDLDGLWHEQFKKIARRVLVGRVADTAPDFATSVRQLIDCRLLGYSDGSQAINYLTSHDVGGFENERLFNFLVNNGVVDTERRIKLGFVCLLTAVGIPMILAGDEFADPQELDINQGSTNKQIDPINYTLLSDDWRQRIFDYVARLVQFRITSDALADNDTSFFPGDFTDGKRVMVWQRGSGDSQVVVIANFSDYGTPNPFAPGAEYVVPNWPALPAGKSWHEITQDRAVPTDQAGREPIFPWEAKVYAMI
jgi:1,4-alpha-glucan branching enzyme